MIDKLLKEIVKWAQSNEQIRAVALVGSHACNAARPESDVDIVCLVIDPEAFRSNEWMTRVDWQALGVEITGWNDQDYGGVWSRHTQLSSGLEIEFSFGALEWASTQPIDPGTRGVMTDGHQILYDPDGILAKLASALTA